LGLKGSRVSEDEIKTAYKQLAKKYHPDLNPGDSETEERFKEVNEAKDTLFDPKKRKRYNIRYYFHIFDNGINIDAEKLKNSEFVKIFVGEEEYKAPEKVFDNTTSKSNLDDHINLSLTLEEAFEGVTKQILYKPYGEPQRKITVRIPRGSNDETQILLKGEGKKANFGSENGNLFINVGLERHKEFRLEKIDLIKNVVITPAEAAIGCEKEVPSIDITYNLKIPAGTQPGEVLKIKNAGFISKDGKRGDLQAVIKLDVPKELSNKEKELYEKLNEIHNGEF
jgi:curved DNA-binding protein